MLLLLKVDGEPDFYPDHIDVEHLPPAGTVVEITPAGEATRSFTLYEITMRVVEVPVYGGGFRERGSFVALLRPTPAAPAGQLFVPADEGKMQIRHRPHCGCTLNILDGSDPLSSIIQLGCVTGYLINRSPDPGEPADTSKD